MRLLSIAATLFLGFISSAALAAGLLVNATEIGVGKFHRYDNHVHTYTPNNVWADHITPDGATQTPIVVPRADGSVTIQFSTLEEMLQSLVAVAKQKQTKVAVLNINAHGMPGGMWFPKDAKQLGSFECSDWVQMQRAPDVENYNEYYGPVSKSEIMQLRATANYPAHYSCVVGLPEWKEIVYRIPGIQQVFTDDAQIHLESCLVGLGPVGEAYTTGIGQLLLAGNKVMVKSSTNFGLGDWSMPEGMGFWDYFTDDQLDHDNQVYPVDKKDREIMKKGVMRVASKVNGQWQSSLVADQDFMLVGMGFSTRTPRVMRNVHQAYVETALPAAVRIVGTKHYVRR